MSFPCLISSICRATKGLAAKYFKNDEAKPSDIDSSILQKSAAHSSRRRGALLTEPLANASVNTWLKKIFCLEVAMAKGQQKIKREVHQIERNQRQLAYQNKWLYGQVTSQSSATLSGARVSGDGG
ncbi:hypothetical protein RHGRI_016179 [Rhododendron griersonianum]|uniref:Uncharacterized protein n=1 Tax=Rhododendron griersonianum TaxID=479676 RepID=A0AAV6JT48_9ERIC|nr:hypothetical protein RHGRI_016179 [Rhododendron griersonianum]